MSDLIERLRELLRRLIKEADRVYIAKAIDEIARLDGLREQSEFVIDLLESNARVQAKLLADTGRERDELRKQLERAHEAMRGEIQRSHDAPPTWEEVEKFLGPDYTDDGAAEVYFTRKIYWEIGQRLRAVLTEGSVK